MERGRSADGKTGLRFGGRSVERVMLGGKESAVTYWPRGWLVVFRVVAVGASCLPAVALEANDVVAMVVAVRALPAVALGINTPLVVATRDVGAKKERVRVTGTMLQIAAVRPALRAVLVPFEVEKTRLMKQKAQTTKMKTRGQVKAMHDNLQLEGGPATGLTMQSNERKRTLLMMRRRRRKQEKNATKATKAAKAAKMRKRQRPSDAKS